MNVNRSGYYKWQNRRGIPNRYEEDRILLTELLQQAHKAHPSHGLDYTYKSRHITVHYVTFFSSQRRIFSMTHKPYDEDFKKSIVALYQNGKTQTQLAKEYGVSLSALGKWIRQYSEVKTIDGDIMTAKQIKELQKRMAQLEEENIILKKAIAIFTPHSDND